MLGIIDRNIVGMIYRLIHQHNTKLLINQYEQIRWIGLDSDDTGYCIKMVGKNVNDDYFMFNYRELDDPFIDGSIYHCDTLDVSVANLTSNYWYSSGKSSPRGYKDTNGWVVR